MAVQRTLSIVKPDAVAKNVIGEIYARFEKGGLSIVAAKMLRLTKAQAGEFYAVHKQRPFYDDLVEFMTSGPVMVQVLEGENAINRNREIMGATNPADAAPGTMTTQGASSMYLRPVLSMVPQEGSGGWAPRPRKERAASTTMALAKLMVACTMMGAAAFGSTCSTSTRQGGLPKAVAAST